MLLSGSRLRLSAFSQTISRASLPDRPTALPPCALIAATMRLLMPPASTISTTSTASAVVTRSPSRNSVLTPSRSSIWLICGPPPCTTTGWTPHCFISTMSRAKASMLAASPMAWPPNFTTIVVPS